MDMACREEETVPMQIQKNDEKEACRELPMRSEQQIYDIILGYAESEEQVRLVTLEGSRTNRNILPDEFQDYDITFFVTDMDSFMADDAWLDVFGKRLLSTYRMGSYGEMWTALEQCMTLFRKEQPVFLAILTRNMMRKSAVMWTFSERSFACNGKN